MAEEFTKFGGVLPIERSSEPGLPMTLEEFVEADQAVQQALKGDHALICARLRSAENLLNVERNLAAAIIEGKIKQPRHRTSNPGALHSRDLLLARRVRVLMDRGEVRKNAVADVAANGLGDKKKLSIRTVQKAVKNNPDLFASFVPRK